MSNIPTIHPEFQIHVTMRCNFRCRHCYLSCNADGSDMSLKQGYAVIDEIADLSLMDKRIVFTGGEATLNIVQLTSLIKRAASAGIKTVLFSNGWWGVQSEIYSQKLAGSGLNEVRISCDQYHLEYTSWETVKRAFNSLERVGVDVKFWWVSSYCNESFTISPAIGTKHQINEMLKFVPLSDIVQYFLGKPYLTLGRVIGTGRAESLKVGKIKRLGKDTWRVPAGISLAVLPGNVFSMNCTFLSEQSRHAYLNGELVKTAISWQDQLHRAMADEPEAVINSCDECRKYFKNLFEKGAYASLSATPANYASS